jgi:hypothetical protein
MTLLFGYRRYFPWRSKLKVLEKTLLVSYFETVDPKQYKSKIDLYQFHKPVNLPINAFATEIKCNFINIFHVR